MCAKAFTVRKGYKIKKAKISGDLKLAYSWHTCFLIFFINNSRTSSFYRDLIMKMKHTKKARGVVMFVDEDHLRRILSNLDIIMREDSTFNDYFW